MKFYRTKRDNFGDDRIQFETSLGKARRSAIKQIMSHPDPAARQRIEIASIEIEINKHSILQLLNHGPSAFSPRFIEKVEGSKADLEKSGAF